MQTGNVSMQRLGIFNGDLNTRQWTHLQRSARPPGSHHRLAAPQAASRSGTFAQHGYIFLSEQNHDQASFLGSIPSWSKMAGASLRREHSPGIETFLFSLFGRIGVPRVDDDGAASPLGTCAEAPSRGSPPPRRLAADSKVTSSQWPVARRRLQRSSMSQESPRRDSTPGVDTPATCARRQEREQPIGQSDDGSMRMFRFPDFSYEWINAYNTIPLESVSSLFRQMKGHATRQ